MERATHNFGTSLVEYFKTGNYDNASKLIVYTNTQLVDNIGMSTLSKYNLFIILIALIINIRYILIFRG